MCIALDASARCYGGDLLFVVFTNNDNDEVNFVKLDLHFDIFFM